MDNSILLHVCCAPCASACIERLQEEQYKPVLFFSNSNINTEEEFQKRLIEVRRLAKIHCLELIEDPYDHQSWLKTISGMEKEPEKGKRCLACFRFSLSKAALQASGKPFCTSLTVSPHKRSSDIFSIGTNYEGFQSIDFKKKNGFQRSLIISKDLNLYRQDYCGCEFSIRD